ncbi:MAG TPA: shikimate kinase [Candidatus Limnocylindrales bacterium]|nr:shikimate kinase [Candidatus Limnocylindrales bacterium]
MSSLTPLRHLVLVGLMGTGKTTTGRILAARLGWPMVDSDAEIEAGEGRTVRELRDELGTDAMHDVEARALLRALARPGPDVVGAAASTIDRDDCREALRGEGVAVAWVTASPAVAAARFRGDDHRPRYGDDIEAFLARQLRERAPHFRSLDPVEVSTDARTPDEVADAVLEGLRARGIDIDD